MDYKYIEQLLERYWACETSVEEEQILRSFFRQKEIPVHLLPYKSLFIYQDKEKEIGLGEDFDQRILAEIERPVVRARRLTLHSRLMPFFKAAAAVVFLFLIGGVVKRSVGEDKGGVVYVYDEYRNQQSDPQVAYESDTLTIPADISKGSEIRKSK